MMRVALSVVRQSILKTEESMAAGASGEKVDPPILARPRPGACLFTRQAPVVTMAASTSGEEAEAPVLARPRPSRASLITVLGLDLHDTMADWIKLYWDWSSMAQQR